MPGEMLSTSSPYCVAFIFARGGSKGVPGKNIRMLGGKPLIGHSIDAARQSAFVTRIVVSTDDEHIADIAVKCGAEVPFLRPPELATDNSPEWLSWQHALRYLQKEEGRQAEIFVSLPPTSPFRSAEDIDKAVDKIQAGDAEIVVSVTESHRSPYFNMLTENDQGFMNLVIEPDERVHRRQDCPVVYDMTTVVYAARPQFVLGSNSLFDGKIQAVVVPKERALDIDTELDFSIAECLIGQSRTMQD